MVPVIDLRLKLMRAAESTVPVSLSELLSNASARVIGIVVDSVSDVITLSREQIRPPPALGNHTDTRHIIGFGTRDERMHILMDVERLVASMDLGNVDR